MPGLCDALAQHALEVPRVLGLQQASRRAAGASPTGATARSAAPRRAAAPAAAGARRRQRPALAVGAEKAAARSSSSGRCRGRPCTSRSGTPRCRTAACRRRRSRSRRSRTGARPGVVVEHHVVAEQVGVDRPARQRRRSRRGGDLLLEGQSRRPAAARCSCRGTAAPAARSPPPGQAAQVGLVQREVRCRPACIRASIAPTCAQCAASGARRWLPGSRVAQRRRLAAQAVHQLAAGSACGSGTGMPRCARCCISCR